MGLGAYDALGDIHQLRMAQDTEKLRTNERPSLQLAVNVVALTHQLDQPRLESQVVMGLVDQPAVLVLPRQFVHATIDLARKRL